MSVEKNRYYHKLYQYKEDIKDADAIAWVFTDQNTMEKIPFCFPKIKSYELRCKILYSALCQSDVMTVRQKWGEANYPIAPGHEIIGEVILLGDEVKDFSIGDIVGFGAIRHCCDNCIYCSKGMEELCEGTDEEFEHGTYGIHWGGYATHLQQPSKFFYKIPNNFDIKIGAPLLCAGITVFYPMKRFLKPEMNTCVIGIGGLGHLAVKFLKNFGNKVTAFTTSKEKIEEIKSFGADEVIISTNEEEMKKCKIKYDFVVNTLPVKGEFKKIFDLCAKGGYLVQVGMPNEETELPVKVFDLVCREIIFVGSCDGPRWAMKEMLNLCAEKKIYPLVEEFKFEDFPKAFDKLENGKPHFRCVVNVKDYLTKFENEKKK